MILDQEIVHDLCRRLGFQPTQVSEIRLIPGRAQVTAWDRDGRRIRYVDNPATYTYPVGAPDHQDYPDEPTPIADRVAADVAVEMFRRSHSLVFPNVEDGWGRASCSCGVSFADWNMSQREALVHLTRHRERLQEN